MTNASVGNKIAVLSTVVAALVLSIGAFASTAHAQVDTTNGGYGGFGSADYGSADLYPTDFGSADLYPSSYGSSDLYSGSYGSADLYPSNYGSADLYPANYGSADLYPTNYGSGDLYPANYGSADLYPSYSSSPSGSSYGSSYGSSATYGSSILPSIARQAIPSYAMQYLPSYISSPSVPHTPVYTTSSAPTNNTNVNSNTNTPTAVATATVAPITNVNTASTGAITNTFAPVINVNGGAQQHLAQATLPVPACSIYAGNAYQTGYNNQPITLTWSSQNATSAYLSPNVGSVQTQGSRTVYPNGYTTYTMTVYGPGGSNTCQATASYTGGGYVTPPPPVYTAGPAPIVPAVSLSQIPYTGFDFGPVGNAMYWAALFALAASAAYLLVYYLPGNMKLAMGFAGNARSLNAYDTEDVREVFKSSFAPATVAAQEIPSVLDDEPSSVSALPIMENYRVTTDSMIVDSSNGMPRIVIARQ